MEKVKISTEFIKLDQLIKFIGIVDSGSEAKVIISEEQVLVNGQIEKQRGKKIRKGDVIEILDKKYVIE